MIDGVVEKALKIQGGEDGWVGLREQNKSQKAFLVDELIRLTREAPLLWTVSKSKDIALVVLEDWTVVVLCHPNINARSRYSGGTIDRYTLTIFKSQEEVANYTEFCDNSTHDTMSRRLPIMDLLDMAASGALRHPKTAHSCGMHGFGQSINDSCRGCEEERTARTSRV